MRVGSAPASRASLNSYSLAQSKLTPRSARTFTTTGSGLHLIAVHFRRIRNDIRFTIKRLNPRKVVTEQKGLLHQRRERNIHKSILVGVLLMQGLIDIHQSRGRTQPHEINLLILFCNFFTSFLHQVCNTLRMVRERSCKALRGRRTSRLIFLSSETPKGFWGHRIPIRRDVDFFLGIRRRSRKSSCEVTMEVFGWRRENRASGKKSG